ncbi:MAG: 1-(5-phosphoribosyl)-5-[(5-phosphoribosylamino)methylideneamino]imidazole-4-carboxamide isomerase [Clostridiales bacterium]|nr:1-(5-phosphoribosyl)-5-[(5-phosphoribosylamino)methylideneamino]imidazole-4-carboxamide isomerase [Clostridiales bacterium]
MNLFPAIDILNGECVRLLYGDYAQITKYGVPVEMARKWQASGAQYLHIVDLNAAKSGYGENLDCIKEIAHAVHIPIQTGGGVRTLDDIEARLSAGVTRVILGTACCEDPNTVACAVKQFGAERIVCGIDAKNGYVATRGWLTQSNITPIALGKDMFARGVRYVVYTDITKDGALTGVNVEACKQMSEQTGLHVIASGGVSTLQDLYALSAAHMYGAILGKALYENKFTLESALSAVKE